MKVLFLVAALAWVGHVGASSVCPNGMVPNGQTSTGGDIPCPSGTFVIRTYDCERYQDGTVSCNCRQECERKCDKWCTIFCCYDDCRTVCDTCPNYKYRTCSDCQFCKDTESPTRQPTRRPTPLPTFFPTRAPTKSPVPTPNPTFSPSKSPTMYPTKYPTTSPTLFPTLSPTKAPVPPTTPEPTFAPVPTPEPTPPTVSPTLFPTRAPTKDGILNEDNVVLFSIIFGVGGGVSIAAFVIIYRRRKSGVDTTVAEELMEWKAKHGSMPGSQTGSLANPMYGAVAQDEVKPLTGRPNPNRVSLKGLNVHAWLQEVKEEERAKRQSTKAGTTVEPEAALKMKMKFDFTAENEDELSAKKGDVLLCLDIRDDWFVASNPETGESGIVPRSYVVQYLDDEDF